MGKLSNFVGSSVFAAGPVAMSVVLIAPLSYAQQVVIEPGQWQATMFVGVPGSAELTRSSTQTQCIDRPYFGLADMLEQDRQCAVEMLNESVEYVHFRLHCDASGSELNGEGELRSNGYTVEGQVLWNVQTNGTAGEIEMRVAAQRLGLCSP